jgi:hypothetical protein
MLPIDLNVRNIVLKYCWNINLKKICETCVERVWTNSRCRLWLPVWQRMTAKTWNFSKDKVTTYLWERSFGEDDQQAGLEQSQ